MTARLTGSSVVIRPFAWGDWPTLWAVRLAQLAELGVILDPGRTRPAVVRFRGIGMLAPALPTNWKYPYLPSQAGDYTVPIDHSYYGLFWQDQWKISPKLTLNYGLRWDYEHGL